VAGEGFGAEDQAVPIFFFGIFRIIAAGPGAGLQESQQGLVTGGAQDGVPIVEEQRGLLVGEAGGEAGGGDATGYPGLMAKLFEQAQAE